MESSPMTLDEYQQKCMRTSGEWGDQMDVLVAGAVCLAGEVGEFANWVKKVRWHGHDYQREKIVDELGDILWYLASMSQNLGISLEEIGQYNLEKLARRYPNGFSSERSRNREENAE